MKLKLWQRNVLSALVIMVGGFILFNVAFMLAYLVNMAYRFAARPFVGGTDNVSFVQGIWHYIFIVIVLVISWFVLRSKLGDLAKATYFTMPMAVVLTEVGLQLFEMQYLVWIIGAIIVAAVLFYLYKTKRSWMYYFATLYVAVVMAVVVLAGIEI